MKITLGLLLAFTIGVFCRILLIPLPAPPVLIGSMIVFAMSFGYVMTDYMASHRKARHRHLCGGPTGSATYPENKS